MGTATVSTTTALNQSSGGAGVTDGDKGDIVVSGSGATWSLDSGVIVNADINAAAAIDASKIADGSVSNAEFQYIGTLTSNAQTQIDGKASTGSVTTVANDLAAHLADATDAHDASAISYAAGGSLTSTNVNDAIDELEGMIGGGGYTDEEAQDAVGTILADSASINFTYTDGTPEITAVAIFGSSAGTVCEGNDSRLSDTRQSTVADAAGDTTTWVMLARNQTGDQSPTTDGGLTYNAATNTLTATTFVGALTGNADTATTLTGLTSSVAELNILDGVTASASELNTLDGITASTAELNYTDGVTSAIQTQIDAKAPTASPTFTGTVTLPTGLTGVLRADSGVVSTDSDITDLVSAASDTAAGKVELATAAETTTGTDATRAITPDGLAGSDYGKRAVGILVSDPGGSAITTGDGKATFRISSLLNGWNLVGVAASVTTVSSSGAISIQIRNATQTADMLTTKITIDQSETDSSTAAAAVIDTGNDDVATADAIHVDIDAAGTGAKGLYVELIFQLP